MNNEIKEILEFKENADYKKLSCDEIKVLRDYITNLQHTEDLYNQLLKDYDELQHELEEYKDTETYSKRYLYKANKDRLNANLKLVEENERLKKQLEYLRTDEYLNQVKWERNFNETMNKELKTRIEKAVEYIKERERNTNENIKTINMSRNCYIIEQEEVIDILNGRSDE